MFTQIRVDLSWTLKSTLDSKEEETEKINHNCNKGQQKCERLIKKTKNKILG